MIELRRTGGDPASVLETMKEEFELGSRDRLTKAAGPSLPRRFDQAAILLLRRCVMRCY